MPTFAADRVVGNRGGGGVQIKNNSLAPLDALDTEDEGISKEVALSVLRKRTAGEIVDSAFAIFREQPGKIVLAALPLILIIESISTFSQYRALEGLRNAFRGGLIGLPVPVWVTAAESPLSVVSWLLEFLITVAVMTAAAQAFFGEKISVRRCYRQLIERAGAILGLFFIWAGLVTGPVLISVGLILAAPGFGILTMLFTVPWTIYAWVAFRLAPAALVVEEIGPVDAFRRSARLVSGSWFRVFGIVLMTEFITWIVNTGLQALILLVTSSRPPSGMGFVGVAAAMVLLPAMTVRPFAAIVDVTLYFDLRVRREALDIEAAAAFAAGEELPLTPVMLELKWGIPFSPVPTRPDTPPPGQVW